MTVPGEQLDMFVDVTQSEDLHIAAEILMLLDDRTESGVCRGCAEGVCRRVGVVVLLEGTHVPIPDVGVEFGLVFVRQIGFFGVRVTCIVDVSGNGIFVVTGIDVSR